MPLATHHRRTRLSGPRLARRAKGGPRRSKPLYQQHCAVCHGDRFQGTAQGNPLVGAPLVRGEGVEAIAKSIAEGATDLGMPAWSETPRAKGRSRSLAILIAEERAPTRRSQTSGWHRLSKCPRGIIPYRAPRLPRLTEGDRWSRAPPLFHCPVAGRPHPAHREDARGLTVVSARRYAVGARNGGRRVGNRDSFRFGPLSYGVGWILDVAPHPDFAANGWIYLSFGDRCTDCAAAAPASMIKLIRGRIVDGAWVDEGDHLPSCPRALQSRHRHGGRRPYRIRPCRARLPQPRHEGWLRGNPGPLDTPR